MWYLFKKRKQLSPGAMAYSFEPNYTLPLQSPIGPSVAVRHLRATFQAPQVHVSIRVPTTGLGGLAAGQMILQPLVKNTG